MSRSSQRWLPGALLLFGILGITPPAHAARMVVRLQAAGAGVDGDVTVTLTNADGDTAETTLRDDGESPDVAAGDETWAATTEIAGDTVTVTMTVDGDTYEAGSVTWTGNDAPRDLDLRFDGAAVQARASTAEGSVAPPTTAATLPPGTTPDGGEPISTAPEGSGPVPAPIDGGTPMDGAEPDGPPSVDGAPAGVAPSDGGAPPTPTGPPIAGASPGAPASVAPPPSTKDTTSGASPQLFIGLGVGILALVLIGWLWLSNSRRSEEDIPEPEPEPGLLGPHTPSLSAGPSSWRTAPADLMAVASGLVGRIARHRRVVLATADGISIAPVFGGPVYRSEVLDADSIADLVDALEEQGGPPIAVVLVGDAARSTMVGLRAELSAGVALAMVGTLGDEEDPRAVRCSRQDGHWHLEGPQGSTDVTIGAHGFEPLGPATP
ncbi:MAG: hypothetical protein VX265_10065 [Myxococcota bacterium]|nr:hypothetical protein [Myxococcota bacterium]MEC8424277.1 hypothetical protein [Myxococcota bacterium]